LHLIARVYGVEARAKKLSLSSEQMFGLRQRISARVMGKLHRYLLELQPEVLPKSPAGAAVRYALNQWEALTRFLKDGELEIDNGAAERANRDIAIGRGKLDILRQRQRRQDGSGAANLHRHLQAVRRGTVCLVPRCSRAHPRALCAPTE
jgi:glutathione S-transferase